MGLFAWCVPTPRGGFMTAVSTSELVLIGALAFMLLAGLVLGIGRIDWSTSRTDGVQARSSMPYLRIALLAPALVALIFAAWYLTPVGVRPDDTRAQPPIPTAEPLLTPQPEATVTAPTRTEAGAVLLPDILPQTASTSTVAPRATATRQPTRTPAPTATIAATETPVPSPTVVVLRLPGTGELSARTRAELALRTAPARDAAALTSIGAGVDVLVVGRQRVLDWVRIETTVGTGWASIDELDIAGDVRRVRVVQP
jgi:hypothetical protein